MSTGITKYQPPGSEHPMGVRHIDKGWSYKSEQKKTRSLCSASKEGAYLSCLGILSAIIGRKIVHFPYGRQNNVISPSKMSTP
jgi:hypothetical protein